MLVSAISLAAERPGFGHVAWRWDGAAPGDIWDIAQADDGTLWLATGSGLYRFDGRNFSLQSAPDGMAFATSNMTTLEITDDGALWIGHFGAGVSRLLDGRLSHYGTAQGMPTGMLPRITTDANGRLWAANDGGLRWFDGTRWRPPAPETGIGANRADWVLADSTGRLWISTGAQLMYRPAGKSRFRSAGVAVGPYAVLAERANGEIWLADRVGGLRPVADRNGLLSSDDQHARAFPALHARRIRFMRDGSLWGSHVDGDGVFRIAARDLQGGAADASVLHVDGLTSPYASPLSEDQDGNLWIGTNLGLDRLRAHDIHRLPAKTDSRRGLHSLVRGADGRVYAYDDDERAVPLRSKVSEHATDAHAAVPATLWMAATGQSLRGPEGVAGRLPLPDRLEPSDLTALAFTDAGTAWICSDKAPPAQFDGRTWRRETRLPAHGCSSVASGTGRTWFGYADGRVYAMDDAEVRMFGREDGLEVGPITALHHAGDLMLVAGETGLALQVGQQFRTIATTETGLLNGINGIAVDDTQQLWLYGIRGLVRIALEDLQRSIAADGRVASPRLFDAIDGLPGIARQAEPVQTLALDADGILWMSGNQGIAWLDTNALHRSQVAPQARIGEILFDGKDRLPEAHVPVGGLELPVNTDHLQINYAAASLTRPDRVRYRHRLLGLDEHWHDAGTLAQAGYANLRPGRYRFEVMAGNEDDVWSPVPASVEFIIPPAFVQTAAFKVLLVAAIVALLALAFHLRSRQLAAHFRARLEERHGERERIARDLHDTLLQSIQGLILRLHAASLQLAPSHPVRSELDTAMDLAEQAMAEGRQRVHGLRLAQPDTLELGPALLRVRDELDTPGSEVRLVVEGRPRMLAPCAGEEIYFIGREALLNALHHAGATAIEIEIGYGNRAFSMRIRDDGRGLDSEAPLPANHFGIRGMRERAARLGARFTLWSAPGAGTEIEVVVSAALAYDSDGDADPDALLSPSSGGFLP